MTSLDRPAAQHPYGKLPAAPAFALTSPDLTDGAPLPDEFTADGGNVSPALAWSGFPAATRSFVVSCFDPDAPTPSGWWHWTVADIPSTVSSLDRGAGTHGGAHLPRGAFHVRNDDGEDGYTGAAPPRGDREHSIRDILGLPPHFSPLCLIAVGHPAEHKEPRTQYREDRVHYQHW